MMLESRLKQAALMVAVDICLKRLNKSPERCAKKLMELGSSAYPDRILKRDYQDFYEKFLAACKGEDMDSVRTLFLSIYNKDN